METLTGHDLKQAFFAATQCLERYRDLINALNVFPVPDGDTGTNMLLTMRSGMERCQESPAAAVCQVSSGLAEGTFWGARGNSGVILSQFFKGFAEALQDKEICTGLDLRLAFQRSTDSSYRAVGKPVEGTMLSVIRSMSEAIPIGEPSDVAAVWKTAFVASKEALARTPSQLPLLQEAGVVDAGGLGVVAIVGGIWGYLTGQDVGQADLGIETMAGLDPASRVESPLVADNFLDKSHATRWGYCTQFIIEGESLVLDRVRGDLGKVAESVVVVGDEQHIRVHLHAQDPGPALSYGTSLGQLLQIKIENMSLQNQEWDAGHRFKQIKSQGTAVVATAAGEGLERLFCQSGCSAIIRGGQTMNPSIQDILKAAELSGGQDVILLPNNKNIVVAAEQAARVNVDGRTLHVVPTLSIPQGVAALLAFNPEESLGHNLKAMRSVLAEVVTIEITRAVRDSSIGGLPVQAGQFIALVDGELVLAEATVEAALSSALAEVKLSGSEVVTLYWGSDTTQAQAESAAINLEKANPGLQVDVIYGGQPHYPYIASVE